MKKDFYEVITFEDGFIGPEATKKFIKEYRKARRENKPILTNTKFKVRKICKCCHREIT